MLSGISLKFFSIWKCKKCPARPGLWLCGEGTGKRLEFDGKEKWPYRPLKSYNVDRIIWRLLRGRSDSSLFYLRKIFKQRKIQNKSHSSENNCVQIPGPKVSKERMSGQGSV